jgi:hypothetical protein
MTKLRWEDTRAFFLPGSVRPNMTDAELELLRARMLVAQDVVKKIGVAVIPKGIESQIVELELLWERPDPRSELSPQFIFSFDHLSHTNC